MDLRTKPSLRRRSLTIAPGASAVAIAGLFDGFRITSLTAGASLMARTDEDDENQLDVGMSWRAAPGFMPWRLLVFRNAGAASLTVVYYVAIGGIHSDDRLILDSVSILSTAAHANAGTGNYYDDAATSVGGTVATTVVTGAANVNGAELVSACLSVLGGAAEHFAAVRIGSRRVLLAGVGQSANLPFPLRCAAGLTMDFQVFGRASVAVTYRLL